MQSDLSRFAQADFSLKELAFRRKENTKAIEVESAHLTAERHGLNEAKRRPLSPHHGSIHEQKLRLLNCAAGCGLLVEEVKPVDKSDEKRNATTGSAYAASQTTSTAIDCPFLAVYSSKGDRDRTLIELCCSGDFSEIRWFADELAKHKSAPVIVGYSLQLMYRKVGTGTEEYASKSLRFRAVVAL